MKRASVIFCLLMAFALALCLLAACRSKKSEEFPAPISAPTEEHIKVPEVPTTIPATVVTEIKSNPTTPPGTPIATPTLASTPLATKLPTPSPKPDAEIATDVLNLRSGPGVQYNILGSYPLGTPLDLLGQGPDGEGLPWLFVRTPDGNAGWVSARPSLEETKYVSINLPFSDIEMWPTPTEILPSTTSTPYAIIEEIYSVNVISTPSPPLPPPLFPTGTPGTGSLPWEVTNVSTISCSQLCVDGNTISLYAFNETVCLQWYETRTSKQEMIEIAVILGEQLLGSTELDGAGSYVCRVASVNLNAAGRYMARLCYKNFCKEVSWEVY